MKIDYDTTIELISGETIDLTEFQGKVLLICNTASKCGYTQQYETLRMDFLDSLTDRIYIKGNLTPKQAKWANSMYKQFNKKILPGYIEVKPEKY